MSRKRVLAATVPAAVLALIAAAPADAGVFGFGKKAKPAAEADPAAPADKRLKVPKSAKAAPAPAAARRATAEERTMAQRLDDPLARAAFWGREFELEPRDLEAGVNLTAALRAMGRYTEAADAAGRVLAQSPDHLDGLLEAARSRIGEGQGFYAIAPARRAIVVAPKDWRGPSLLGVAYQQVGRGPEAREAWEKALALSPENPSVLANLALAHAADGDYPKAEGLLRRAAARPDAGLRVRQNLAMVLGLQGQFAEAERLVREDLPPGRADAQIAWLRSTVNEKKGRSWEALKGAGS